MRWFRRAALGAATLALGSCFFAPGKFDSTLELRRDGRFTFAYTGEVLFFEGDPKLSAESDRCFGPITPSPAPPSPAPVRNNLVQGEPVRIVTTQADPEDEEVEIEVTDQEDRWAERPCTPAEKATRAAHRERQQREQAAVMAAVVGFDPTDPASVRAYVAELQRHPGWRRVTHKGGNRFEVDYRLSGTADRDFLFPVFDNVAVHTPFVTVRPRTDGGVEVRAPAFGGGGLGVLGGLGGPFGAGMRGPGDNDPFSQMLKATEGTFTIVTDGDIRTNNTAEGPTARGGDRVLAWKVSAFSREAPRALVQLR